MLWLRGVLRRRCSGRRVVCCWAGLLCVPVGGGPPASRPRRVLLLVAPLVFWAPCGVLLGRAALCARGRRPAREIATREPDGSEWSISRPALALPLPTGTAARPSGPSGALHTGGAWCAGVGLARCPEARPGSEAVSAISHVIPLRIFQTMNSYRWGFNVSGPC